MVVTKSSKCGPDKELEVVERHCELSEIIQVKIIITTKRTYPKISLALVLMATASLTPALTLKNSVTPDRAIVLVVALSHRQSLVNTLHQFNIS